MEHSMKYKFFMSQLTHIRDLKETDKIKISIVSREGFDAPCILRICKGRDLSTVYEALRKIRNPNTAVVYDFVYENGDTYILEELVDGSTISEIMNDRGILSELTTAKIIIEVCRALEVLHNEKPPVVHNDINPSNIRIREDGSVKLFDFDISRTYKKGQSQNTVLFGTEEYAAPEHFGYGQSEPRTDIYGLGVTMHKMLTGRGLSSEHRITYNGKLRKVIQKCLEFDPKNRYASVYVLRRDLEKFLTRKKNAAYKVLGVFLGVVTICGLLWSLGQLITPNVDSQIGVVATDPINDIEPSNTHTTEKQEEPSKPTETETQGNYETTTPTEVALNDTREKAWAITLDQPQTDVCDASGSRWYKFITSEGISACRISVAPIDAPTNMLFPYVNVALYNSTGIKLEEFDAWSDDEYDFIDLYLVENTEYFVKVSLGGRFEVGNYEICISSKACDAGIDKESATELILGEQYSAKIDSTLSDWYVFKIPEPGEYRYTIHNIDVGCDMYFSKQQPRSAGEGMSIENEDNYSGKISNMQEGELVYFEIYPYDNNPEANGGYIIIIEKVFA